MPFSAWFAWWSGWLRSPRRGDTGPPCSPPHAEQTHPLALTTPPTYLAYHVTNPTAGAQGEACAGWTRVGAAWLHHDGMGFDVVLEVMPLDGRFILCAPLEGERAGGHRRAR